nr:CusA/CzcA family heavy metal efflux RND transporter [Thermoflexibacter sp.]
MIDKIIAFSVRNPLVIGILVGVMALWGGFSLSKLPIDAVPDVTSNQVDIITNTPSLAPLEMEMFVTAPIEMAMSNIPGLVEIRSISKFGLSVVKVVFTDDTDIYWARQQVFERLEQVANEIPAGVGKPYMGPASTGLGEVFQYIIRPKDPKDKSFSLMEIRTMQDWVIRKQLLGIAGIAEVSGFGGYKKEYQAKINPERMKALNVTVDELFEALSMGNSNTGGAYIEKQNKAFTIRGIGLATDLEEIGNTVVKMNNNIPVLVRDVADVDYGNSIRYGAITYNGVGETVGGIIMMTKGANGNEVITRIKKKMEEIGSKLPEGLVIEPFIDRSKLVNNAITTVMTNLLEGAIIVVLVIIVFLGNWRASLLAASVIPLAMLFAFGWMKYFDVVGNIMSLGAIDFGLLVDPAIIVVETVVLFLANEVNKRVRSNHNNKPMSYKMRQEIVIDAAQEVKKSVVFGGLIILIVYFPILTLEGVEGKMFAPMAKTVGFAILGALILSVSYVPMMSALILRPPKSAHSHGISEIFVQFIYYKVIEPVVKICLRRNYVAVIAAILILFAGGYGFSKIGGEFIPKLQEGDLVIEVNLPVGAAMTEAINLGDKIQATLMKEFPDEIERIVSKIGTSEVPVDPMPLEAQEIVVVLRDKKLWKKAKAQEDLADLVSDVMKQFPGIVISVQQPIENRVNELMSGARTDVVVKVYGFSLDTIVAKSNQIIGIIKTIEGAVDVQENKIFGLPQINIKYDRKQMAVYGVTVAQMNRAIQLAFAGAIAGTVYENDKRFDLTLRLSSAEREKAENIKNLLVSSSTGLSIPLRELADITEEIGPSEIGHENLKRKSNIGFNVRGRDLESIVNDLIVKVEAQVVLPKGYEIEYGGEFENFSRAKARLGIVVPIALFIIFCLLFASFGTIGDSLLIYTVVPLSAVGGVFALIIRGMNFSISAGVGFIALFGVAVLNGILLVEHFNQLGEMGVEKPEHRV